MLSSNRSRKNWKTGSRGVQLTFWQTKFSIWLPPEDQYKHRTVMFLSFADSIYNKQLTACCICLLKLPISVRRIQNVRWTSFHADAWHATQKRPLELWKYAYFTKPVFCPFLNHWINFWIVMRVSRPVRFDLCPTNPSVTVSVFRFKTSMSNASF